MSERSRRTCPAVKIIAGAVYGKRRLYFLRVRTENLKRVI